MGFLYAKIQRPRGSALRAPLFACRFPSRPDPRSSKYFFFDREKRRGEYNVPQGGGVAQLGEHHVRNVGVEGSIPFSSTIFFFSFRSSVFLIGRGTITLSRFLPGANRLPRSCRRRALGMETEIGFRILGGDACSGGTLRLAGGIRAATLTILRPLAAGSARRTFLLAPQAAARTPPLRRWSPERMHPSGSIMG
jgi:hypothetical protein